MEGGSGAESKPGSVRKEPPSSSPDDKPSKLRVRSRVRFGNEEKDDTGGGGESKAAVAGPGAKPAGVYAREEDDPTSPRYVGVGNIALYGNVVDDESENDLLAPPHLRRDYGRPLGLGHGGLGRGAWSGGGSSTEESGGVGAAAGGGRWGVHSIDADAIKRSALSRQGSHLGRNYNMRNTSPAEMEGGWIDVEVMKAVQAGQHGVGSSTPNTPTGILPEDYGRQGAGPGRGAAIGSRSLASAGGSGSSDLGGAQFEIDYDGINFGETRMRIGIGGYGIVYKANWRGTVVAVKELLDKEPSEAQVQEFREEVKLLSQMRHPNIVLWMGACTTPPNLAIVMEFMQGGSMFKLLHGKGMKLDGARRLMWATHICKGMSYLHEGKPPIIHRDLNTNNLLVDQKGNVKISDFGLSRVKTMTHMRTSHGRGTCAYSCPEVIRCEAHDEKGDLFSFAVVLWEMCTGLVPWEGVRDYQVMYLVSEAGERLPLPEGLDPEVRSLIERCWSEVPSARPSFVEVMEQLRKMKPAQWEMPEGFREKAHEILSQPRVSRKTDAEGLSVEGGGSGADAPRAAHVSASQADRSGGAGGMKSLGPG